MTGLGVFITMAYLREAHEGSTEDQVQLYNFKKVYDRALKDDM